MMIERMRCETAAGEKRVCMCTLLVFVYRVCLSVGRLLHQPWCSRASFNPREALATTDLGDARHIKSSNCVKVQPKPRY